MYDKLIEEERKEGGVEIKKELEKGGKSDMIERETENERRRRERRREGRRRKR